MAAFARAVLILGGPAGFRFTCYYYRKAYYRAFVMHPPACAVSEGEHRGYRGEASFPLILQNIHRYFFYHRHSFFSAFFGMTQSSPSAFPKVSASAWAR